jgi:hypothetical protein
MKQCQTEREGEMERARENARVCVFLQNKGTGSYIRRFLGTTGSHSAGSGLIINRPADADYYYPADADYHYPTDADYHYPADADYYLADADY